MPNSSDSTPQPTPDQPHPAKPDGDPQGEQKGGPVPRSSFDFRLPEGVDTFSDIPPVAPPEQSATASKLKAAIPPSPATTRPPTGSFDFIDLPDVPPPAPAPAAPLPPFLTPTDAALELPPPIPAAEGGSSVSLESAPTTDPSSFTLGGPISDLTRHPKPPAEAPSSGKASVPDIATLFGPADAVPPAPDSGFVAELIPEEPASAPDSGFVAELMPEEPTADDSAAELGAHRPVDPVAPASGWMDVPVAPASGWLDADDRPPAAAGEDFAAELLDAGPPGEDSSDIFTGGAAAALPVEQSDVISATAFDDPVGSAPPADPVGPAAAPADGGTVPIAGELPGSSSLLGQPASDSESIHDLPDLGSDPLFDSASLSDAPDLTAEPELTDGEFGTPDTSSILGEPPATFGPDSSSVRVESPGMGRTLTDGPASSGFDLTVPDEPLPADLFGDESGGTDLEPTDWQAQTGSDLFAEGGAAPELDAVDPLDLDLAADQPSLASAPSSIFSGPAPDSGPSGSSSAPPAGDEVVEFELVDEEFEQPTRPEPDAPPVAPRGPGRAADGNIDWDAAELADGADATRGIPQNQSLADIIRGLGDDSSENPTRDESTVPPAATDADEPVVTVDWMAGSAEGSAMAEPLAVASEPDAGPKPGRAKDKGRDKAKAPEKAKARAGEAPAEKKARPARAAGDAGTGSSEHAPAARAKGTGDAKKGGGLVAGLLLGTLLAGGAMAALYFGDVIPNGQTKAQAPAPNTAGGPPAGPGVPGPNGPPVVPPGLPGAAPDPRSAFAAGDTAKALELLNEAAPTTAAGRAAAGHVRVFAKVQGVGTDADLEKGRADLRAAIADADADKTPEGLKRTVQAIVTLGVSYEAAGDVGAARKVFADAKAKYPQQAEVFDALLDRLAAPPAPGASFRLTPADLERALLGVAVVLVQDGPKADDAPEPGTFYWKAVKLAAEGSYAEAVDLIGKAKAAHVKRAKALAGRGLNPLTDPLEQMFPRACDELAAAWKLKGELYGVPGVADAIKKDGVDKAFRALVRAQKEAADLKLGLARTDAELMKTKADSDARAELYKAQEKAAALRTAEVATERDALQARLAKTEKQLAGRADALAKVADALKPAVPLPEKWGDDDLIAAAKSAAARATGPDLKVLIPDGMVAVGGGGLAAGQLLDIADRLGKAEAAAKGAAARLAAETKKLNDRYDADTAKLKAAAAAEAKKLTDAYAADLTKLKEANAGEAKKLADKFAADVKKLTDDQAAALKTFAADRDAAVAAERAKAEAEKKAAARREVEFQKQLANVVTPGQALDTWLPVLTDLRRPADADPALALAKRALAGSLPDSEDAAKAHTVAGMGLLLKGDLAGARDEFRLARRNPAYAAEKAWAKVADAGLEAVDDPLAPYRKPVAIPPTDEKAAARALDAGVAAYRAGRYEAAAAALTDAAKNAPTDPVPWYYLGAARWAQGNEAQARKDIDQGAERERAAAVPSRTVSAALGAIQGSPRDAIDRARP